MLHGADGLFHDALVRHLTAASLTTKADAELATAIADDLARLGAHLPPPTQLQLVHALASVPSTTSADLAALIDRYRGTAGPLAVADIDPLVTALARHASLVAASAADGVQSASLDMAAILDSVVAALPGNDSRAHQALLLGARRPPFPLGARALFSGMLMLWARAWSG